MPLLIPAALFIFGFSFCVFAVQSGDVVMYLALARDFIFPADIATSELTDRYLYSISGAPLVWKHEYLSYLFFFALHAVAGPAGLIFGKTVLLTLIFGLTLSAPPRAQNRELLWILLWILAVLAASFRFIERASLFSDLFSVLLVWILTQRDRLSSKELMGLCFFFALWIQLHPGFPIGLGLLFLWALHRTLMTRTLSVREAALLLLPPLALLINPLGLDGALYPFQFSLNEAQTLKQYNFEWFASYHPAFRTAPEVVAFWIFSATSFYVIIHCRLLTEFRAWVAVFALLSATLVVRFIPWACFAVLIALKPWLFFSSLRKPRPAWLYALSSVLILIAVKNISLGYHASSGQRLAKLEFDEKFFPFGTLRFLREHPIPGRLYNTHDFGSFLIWQQHTPIFHHGFVTDMNFYERDVMGVFQSQQRFLELARKYNWTMLLVEKYGAYAYFHKILSPLKDWRIVAEDPASYLIYFLPDSQSQQP